ncbi:MAG TPA: DUF4474 domain-containing protein [Mobilitalea sp.]|nr:DUF4474 domain-containing protein [Mobilitalea sp.]
MFLIQMGYNPIINIAALWAFYIQNKAVVIISLLLLLFTTSIYFRRRRKKNKRKKKREQRVVRPITDVVGTNPERLAELNNDLEPFGFAYEPMQDFFYSVMNGWQRGFGYCRLYDEATAVFSMIIDCEPIPFKYNGVKYLIEFWKGQYGMTSGCEVGVYYTTGPDLNIPGFFNGTFYYALKDEHRINMSFACKKNGNLLFTRNAYHWWITGFKLGEFSQPSELSMDITMDLYDQRMAYAFGEALMNIGYTDEEFAVRGRRVYIRFTKPHTPQPITRSSFTEHLMQKNNRSFCDAYQYLTEAYTDTLDKLEIVRNESPNMYNQILSMGKPRQVFDSYNKIKNFIDMRDKL